MPGYRSPVAAAVFLTAALLALPLAANTQTREADPFAWEGRLRTDATLEIKGVSGSVRAVPSSGATARVEAYRTGRRNDPSEVRIGVVEHAGGVTVCALYPVTSGRANECAPGDAGRIGARNNDVQVRFVVHVPASAHFVARTSNGDVVSEGVSGRVATYSTNGDVRIEGSARAHARTTNGSIVIRTHGEADARTTNGRITAHLNDLAGSQPLSFSTTNGSITLGLPAGANATIDARTSNGSIRTDLPLTVQGRVSRNSLTGTLGSGGRPIQVRTTNGSIHIERSH